MSPDSSERIALFRYQVIAPLLSVDPRDGPRGALKREVDRLTRRLHEHPVRGPIRVGRGTMREWLSAYRRGGLDGLLPVGRRDAGQSRAIDDRLAEFIEDLARGRPDLDGPAIHAELASHFNASGIHIPSLSSIYRFLRAKGLDQRRSAPQRDHRAYQFDLAGDCWQGDVMYGPALPQSDGRRRKTYLVAILDDATRVIAHAEFYYEQHLSSLKDTLKQAFQKRGVPTRLYFDNGRIFRSRALIALAARLGIHLIHSRPYRPQGRAKIERWFLTVRRRFLARLDFDRLTLQELNRLLWAWVEGEYHQRAHRGLDGECPMDRWLRLSGGLRPLPGSVDVDELFLEETTRRVAKDGTIRIHSRVFEVGPSFLGTRVSVHFDRFDLRRVIVSLEGRESIVAYPVDFAGNRRVKRQPEPDAGSPPPAPPLRALDDLARSLDPDPQDGPTDWRDNPAKEDPDAQA